MAEYPGNILQSPGFNQLGYTVDDEVLYSMVGYTQKGITLATGQGILPLGTVMGRVTASKLWKVYNNGASDGTEVARGILRNTVDTGSSTSPLQANIVVQGLLKNSKISGADAASLVDLGATQDTVLDLFRI